MISPLFSEHENDSPVDKRKPELHIVESEEDSGFNGSNSTDSSSVKMKSDSPHLTASTSYEIIESNEQKFITGVNELVNGSFPPISQTTSSSCPLLSSTLNQNKVETIRRTLSQPAIHLKCYKNQIAQSTRKIDVKRYTKSALIRPNVNFDKKDLISSNSLPVLTEDRKIRKKLKSKNTNLVLEKVGEDLSSKSSSKSLILPPIILKRSSPPPLCHSNSLPCLKINDARKRNFLIGNLESKGALLGAGELERHFPTGKMNLFVATWNVHKKCTSESLDDLLLPRELEYIPDMYVVGIEEAAFANKQDWELKLQETIGLSHVLFHSASLGALHLSVFLRRELIWFCSVAEDSTYKLNASINTKGAVAIQFLLFGTSFLFICSHLTAHVEKLNERIQDYKKIIANINLPQLNLLTSRKHRKELFDRYDCVFWMGDLNFRLNQKRDTVLSQINLIKENPNPNFDDILLNDQLKKCISEGLVFKGFNEGRINFMPTYKYDAGTNKFDSSEKLRTPSYTDRILYRNRKKNTVSCVYYNSVQSICSSDHKPVYAVFEVTLRPGRDNVPLAAAFFKRDIYLNAISKRTGSCTDLTSKARPSSNSTICSIM